MLEWVPFFAGAACGFCFAWILLVAAAIWRNGQAKKTSLDIQQFNRALQQMERIVHENQAPKK